MKDWLNITIRQIIRFIMHLFFVFPIKQNRLFFQSYQGRAYTCNPKYISEYIQVQDEQYEHIWVLNKPKNFQLQQSIKVIKKNSLRYFYYRFTSKFIICNMTDEVYLPKRKKQMVINTWHAGGAYKRVGISYDKTHSKANEWQNNIVRQETSLYLSSSAAFTQFNIKEAYRYEGDILKSGMPRNDLFFNPNKLKQVNQQVRETYGIAENAFVIVYAPTFRGDFSENKTIDFVLPIEKIVSALQFKQQPIVLLNRSHYSLKSAFPQQGSHEKVFDVSDYPDMQELLAASDCLITDYSSSIWDYSLLERPCLLYVPDLSEYNGDRGFYIPIAEWPGVVCQTEETLIDTLKNIAAIDFKRIASQHQSALISYESGNACQMVYAMIKRQSALKE